MSEQRDPQLESIFAEAQRELVDDRFTSGIMTQLKSRRRRLMAGRLAILALVVALELVLDSPLQHSVGTVTDLLGKSLFTIDHEWIAFVVSPVNTIAGLLGGILIGLHTVYRRIFY